MQHPHITPRDTTARLIDVGAADLIIERIKGLIALAENQLDSMVGLDRMESIPLNAAIWCLTSHVEQLDDLLNAGIDLERQQSTSHPETAKC